MSHRLYTTCYSRLAWWWVRPLHFRWYNLLRSKQLLYTFQKNKTTKKTATLVSNGKAHWNEAQSLKSRGFRTSLSSALCQPNCSFVWHVASKYGFFFLGESMNHSSMEKNKRKENHSLIPDLLKAGLSTTTHTFKNNDLSKCDTYVLIVIVSIFKVKYYAFLILSPQRCFIYILRFSCCFSIWWPIFISLLPIGVT